MFEFKSSNYMFHKLHSVFSAMTSAVYILKLILFYEMTILCPKLFYVGCRCGFALAF